MNTYNLRAQPFKQRGLAAVESAIVLPLVIFVMLAVAEFGHAIQEYNRLTQAVRDGARYLANEAEANANVLNITAQKISDTANLVAYGNTSGASANILPGFSAADVTVVGVNGTDISVTAEYDYNPVFFPNIPGVLGGNNNGGAITMRAQVIMRAL